MKHSGIQGQQQFEEPKHSPGILCPHLGKGKKDFSSSFVRQALKTSQLQVLDVSAAHTVGRVLLSSQIPQILESSC